jgi:Uma2 family endonuclease
MQAERVYLTFADYLAREEQSPHRHEYVDGEMFAMSGASRAHNKIASNLHLLAGNAAKRAEGCDVFGPSMKLYVEKRNSAYYPDLTVACDPGDNDRLFVTRPCFVVEVLSPSTAHIDRREKRSAYETLPSLQEYLIVDQDRMRVYVYFRRAGVWLVQILTQPEDIVTCSCLNLRMTLQQIYDGVVLPPFGVEEPQFAYGEDAVSSEPIYDLQ